MPYPVSPRRQSALFAVLAVFCLVAAAVPATASVIQVTGDLYRLDDGRTFKGPWDVAQELIAAKEYAIVVMEPKANKELLQLLIQTLETFNIPNMVTKAKDFMALTASGVIVAKPANKP